MSRSRSTSASSAKSGGGGGAGEASSSRRARAPSTERPRRNSGGDAPYDYLFKTLVIGDSSVGKSALSVRFAHHSYHDNYTNTVGLDLTKRVVDVNGSSCKLHIWDTAGQERFRTIVAAYYRDAHGLLLVYDVTSRTSFTNVRKWLTDVERHTAESGQNICKVLVGNKIDLVSTRQVTTAEGKALADSLHIPFFETSAKADVNVETAFMTLARDILRRLLAETDAASRSSSSGVVDLTAADDGGGADGGDGGGAAAAGPVKRACCG